MTELNENTEAESREELAVEHDCLIMSWVSVRESLPDPVFDWVLVCSGGAMATVAYNEQNGFYEVHGNVAGNIDFSGITHWMNLPNEPVAEA